MRSMAWGRAGLLVLVAASPLFAAPWLAREAVEQAQLSASPDPASAAPALMTLVAFAGLAIGWLWLLGCVLVCTADAVRELPPRTGPLRPTLVRVLVTAVIGSTVAMAAPAHAGSAHVTSAAAVPAADLAPDVSGLPLPDRPGGDERRTPAPGAAATDRPRDPARAEDPGRAEDPDRTREPDRPHRRGSGSLVVVRPGDTLWGLTASALSPTADPSEIDAGWRAVYRLNAARIGRDPDLIHPGLRLRLPAAWPDSTPAGADPAAPGGRP